MSETAQLDDFRTEVRAWLEDNCPAEMREPIRSDSDVCWGGRNYDPTKNPVQKRWLDLMAEKGWTAPTWPTEYGGGGLTGLQAKVLKEEMAAINARNPLNSFGVSMLGPALLHFGTEEQKQRFLPPIVRGEIRWCQGYSEPGAGSDLAAVATKAVDHGDHWIINGQKVWTSYGDKADWMFCLVRTDPNATKHNGISFVLFDMETKGVEAKPIKLISGYSPFCETFFDDVRVEKENLIGELNRGWDVAKYLLGHEREMISGFGLGGAAALGSEYADILHSNPVLRAQIAMFDIKAEAFKACSELFFEDFKAGRAHPAKPSMMKYFGTELNKERNELHMAAGGTHALEWESEQTNNGAPSRTWLRSKGNSIEGGTSEVQLNIIAKRILQLPGA